MDRNILSQKLLPYWWENLARVEEMQDLQIIHKF
jgi:hypothetical protein